ncbi:nuclear transport factor 2 family protein [Streptomyces sp. SudanB182_2057]|uniref:nuclear transport factor 2 family protein n=1 Tax=Streptomyces sp. SudanB182_2057 TaxID=3035281 RepID=UPI003F54E894
MLFQPGRAEEAVDTCLSPDYMQHNPGVADGREPLARCAAGMVASVPGLEWNLRRAIAEDDLVAVHRHMTTGPGTSGRGRERRPASGRTAEAAGTARDVAPRESSVVRGRPS